MRVEARLLASTAVLAIFSQGRLWAQSSPIVVQPGAVFSITVPIQNADSPNDGDPINNVQLVLTSQSSLVSNITPSQVDSVAPGETKNFTATFTVDPNAQSGSFTVNLMTKIDDDGIDPDPATLDTSVSFNGREPSFLVGAQLRAVWQNRPFGGLKFSGERLLYRQAGRRSELMRKERGAIPLGRSG